MRSWCSLNRLAIPPVLFVVAMMCACSSRQPVTEDPQSAGRIPLPAGCLEGFLSPDGSWLACLGTLADESGIWLQDVEGDGTIPVALGSESESINYHSLAWALDSEKLAFVSFEGLPPGADYRLSLFSLDEGRSTVLYEGEESITGMKWSPEGNSLAAVDGDKLRVVRLNGSHDVLLEEGVALAPLSANGLAWSPDGRKLVCPVSIGDASELHVIDVSTSEEEVLWPNSDARVTFIPSWSLDGQRIAIVKGRYLVGDPSEENVGLIVLDADGSNPVQVDVPGTAFELGADLLWSPDGAQVATILRSGTAVDVWLIEVEGGTARQLTESGDIQKIIRWAADGEAVLTSTWEVIEVIPVGS